MCLTAKPTVEWTASTRQVVEVRGCSIVLMARSLGVSGVSRLRPRARITRVKSRLRSPDARWRAAADQDRAAAPAPWARPRGATWSRRLREGLHRRLSLVAAPAGWGKTSLLAEWLTVEERSGVSRGSRSTRTTTIRRASGPTCRLRCARTGVEIPAASRPPSAAPGTRPATPGSRCSSTPSPPPGALTCSCSTTTT